MGPGMIDEDVTHNTGGNPQHSAPVTPHRIGAVSKPQIRLIHECSWLKSVVSALEAHFAHCQLMQLPVEARGEIIPGFLHRRR
jgi:hypothetical protein